MTIVKKVSGSVVHTLLDVLVAVLTTAFKHIGFWDIFVVVAYGVQWGILFLISGQQAITFEMYLFSILVLLGVAILAAFSDNEKLCLPKTKVPILAIVAFVIVVVGLHHDLWLIESHTYENSVKAIIFFGGMPLLNISDMWLVGPAPFAIILLLKLILEPLFLAGPDWGKVLSKPTATPATVVPNQVSRNSGNNPQTSVKKTQEVSQQPKARVERPVETVFEQTQEAPVFQNQQRTWFDESTKSWENLGKDLWQSSEVKEKVQHLVTKLIEADLWEDPQPKPGTIFFQGIIPDLQEFVGPFDSSNAESLLIEILDALTNEHETTPFRSAEDFQSAREAHMRNIDSIAEVA